MCAIVRTGEGAAAGKFSHGWIHAVYQLVIHCNAMHFGINVVLEKALEVQDVLDWALYDREHELMPSKISQLG